MRAFIAETWRFIAGQRDHPIYRHEVAGWSYMRFWRGLRRGCLPLVVLVLLGGAFACGAIGLLSLTSPIQVPEDLLLVAFTALIGLLAGGEIIRWLTGLLATILAATTISAEVEAETYGLLRLTAIPVRQIVLAKFGASFRQFHLPLAAVAAVRVVFVLGLAVLAPLAAAQNLVSAPPLLPLGAVLAGLRSLPAAQAVLIAAAGIAVILALLVWLAYYLVEPTLTTLMFAAFGMFASSVARTRAGGLTLAAGVRVALWGLSYVLGQVVSVAVSFLALPVMALPAGPLWLARLNTIDPAALVAAVALAAIAWALILTGAPVAVSLLTLHATVRRAEHLPRPG